MTRLFSTLFAVFLFHTLAAQNLDKAKLDQYFETLAKNDKMMGSVTLSYEGKIMYQKAFGFADVEGNVAATSSTKYRVGSISKMFTSALILKAVEEGKISLDQKIDKFFPEIENASDISISQLMNHRSGIHSFTSNPDYLTWNTQNKSRKGLYDIIKEGGSDFEPDSKADYSNSNYVLLTWVLEDIYMQPFPSLLKKYITEPLGLKDTYVGQKTVISSNESYSYKYAGEWQKETETDMSIPLGAGAIVSTTGDLTRFIEGLFAGKIISLSSLELMKEMKDNFGRGMFIIPFYDKASFGHTGGIDEFKSMLSYFPEEKLAFAMAVNGSSFDPNQAAIATLSGYFGREYQIPTFVANTLTTEDLDKYLGVYGSPTFPLEVTISKNNNTLLGQATGQPQFALVYESEHIFKFAPAGLTLEFNPQSNEMTLKQGGGNFVLSKK
ncbi:beta-lactamase family protein [Aquiflexum sp. TKW24L]|uniref:serine hydrolase domain-containing protein n=1 Tax=Aquiflexum sp. TKW24L TaxID=2942212 RepID=UPI0020C1424D|nr:serine hydrolase domain-containing protein [Aquiflexum sp. TKW24L]MCL6258469.1 beta-lactamase family protein [Aquiflexum sp. TKW24L]